MYVTHNYNRLLFDSKTGVKNSRSDCHFKNFISLLWKISLLAEDVELKLLSSKEIKSLNYKANESERID